MKKKSMRMESASNNDDGQSYTPAVCAGCLNLLDDDDEFIDALDQEWHTECFRCSACDAALSNWYFEKDGMLFCKNDYWSKYGESCQHCGQIITGPVMVAGDHKFHPECFCCASCGGFIGDGESYALVERSKLYCGVCYKRQMQPLVKTSQTPFARKPHSIRLVELAPTTSSSRGIKLSVEACPNYPALRISQFMANILTKVMKLAVTVLEAAFSFCCLLSRYRYKS